MYQEFDAPRKAIRERRAQWKEELEKCTQASRDARAEKQADFDQKMEMFKQERELIREQNRLDNATAAALKSRIEINQVRLRHCSPILVIA